MGKTPRRCFPPSRLSAGGDARGCTLCSARQWSSISTASVLHGLTFGVDGRGWHPPDTWDLCSAHPHGTGVRSLRPLVTCRKKKKKRLVCISMQNILFREKKVHNTRQSFPWRLRLSSQRQKQISARKDRLLIPSSSSSSLQPSANSLTIRNPSTGFPSF